jgi:N-acetylmuramoyl-L-alanine amidase
MCIDAGHGGADAGAIGFGAVEKGIAAEVALRTAELLHGAGCLVFLTRVGDRRVTLAQRLMTAQGAGADLFLSLHCSLSPWQEQRGVTAFYGRGEWMAQAWAETVTRAAASRLAGRTPARGAQPIRWRDRCAGAALLHALRGRMPACLVELGHLSNPHDARLLQDRLFLDDLARGLAAAALAWREWLPAPGLRFTMEDTERVRSSLGRD